MSGQSIGAAAVALLAMTGSAGADASLKLEPGVAIPLTKPQSEIYDVGGGQSLKLLFGVSRYLDIGPSASFLFLPSAAPLTESGVLWGFGGGFRLKRPHDSPAIKLSPWLDADLLYMRTGDLNRLGFDAAVGLAFAAGESNAVWVGPFVRYTHTLSPAREGYDSHDAKILIAGLSIEFGSGIKPKPAPPPPPLRIEAPPAPPPEVIVQQVVSCPDKDADTIPDTIDRCIDVPGPIDTAGCPAPVYSKVVVTKDKLELKEKLFFAWNRAQIKPASFPLLDEVVLVLVNNPNIRIQIEGHTDSSGNAAHNQKLSQRRAESVFDYLSTHGIARERLVAKGFGPSTPLDTNDTPAGRENNRRVEFVVINPTEGSSK